ncbi:hypothetical protein SGQ44_00080 [Flavobacterium sp. Fl-77]|uniref:DUF2059 domain-containing protein n=1 Tax=Flavobacterium flavipigmentatum TaxID=2893884 RepID=A0AAJ2SC89_9FLAO|nr:MULTISPECIES: hypothetical protein [unclassified Flavobacterium]MDX6180530.1 hypothetical protein [Flavobacterium sp. Fl-33]MDX6184130.1 hypothetical protein [Flavobacterium sp. Fl-77]UFH39245.1 hypothetical protein LNP22_02980 [Flavobacterium sp. F-70]
MKNLKKQSFFVLLICLLNTYVGFSQQGPPPPAMPTQQNKIIIDKIIEATKYKTYFVDYCLAKINETAVEEKWNEQKNIEIIESINFKNFRDAIYNMFALYDEIELETLLAAYKSDTAYQTKNAITTNKVVRNNLNIYAKDVAKGKYLLKN